MTLFFRWIVVGVGGFMLVFFIIFVGFSQAHCVLFHGRLESFRTIGETNYTLLRSLLGDFDFLSLQEAHSWLGPILFIIFIALAVFVVLNMLIAIISDAYMDVQAEDQKRRERGEEINLVGEIKDYMYERTRKMPIIGPIVTKFVAMQQKRKQIGIEPERSGNSRPGTGGSAMGGESAEERQAEKGPSQSQLASPSPSPSAHPPSTSRPAGPARAPR